MPIINLKIQGKQAIGDGTKIVCMNSDYVVRVTFEDCETLTKLPVKKLVVKSGWNYRESAIETISEGGETYAQAILPIIKHQDYIDIGVVGKLVDDPEVEPEFTSKSARFHCDSSVLCGAVVFKSDPKLVAIKADSNKVYKALDHGADGFFEVDVQVSAKTEETRTVTLALAGGNQTVDPTSSNRTMSKVMIQKPMYLLPENIKKDINIAGVVGTYEKKLTELTAESNKEYYPPAGYDGFSKVTVNTDGLNVEKTLCVNDSFMCEYDKSADVKMDHIGIVTYAFDGTNKVIFTAVAIGSCSITVDSKNAEGEIVKTVFYSITVVESGYLKPMGNLYIDKNTDGPVNAKEYETVEVNVQPVLQRKEITIEENTTDPIIVSADEGNDALSEVAITVNVSGGNLIEDPLVITENGVTVDVSKYKYVRINIPTFDGGLEIG